MIQNRMLKISAVTEIDYNSQKSSDAGAITGCSGCYYAAEREVSPLNLLEVVVHPQKSRLLFSVGHEYE